MAEELSPDRQRLIFRYMEEAVASEAVAPEAAAVAPDPPADPWAPDWVDEALDEELDAAPGPARLDLVRWWITTRIFRHPQLRLALGLIVLAIAVGWLVARA